MNDFVGVIDTKGNAYSVEKINEQLNKKNSFDFVILNPVDGIYLGSTNSNHFIFNEDKSLLLCFCGKIYNGKKLKTELEQKGHVFNTNDIVEVAIHLYEEFGEDSVKHLDGMFAFSIFNMKTKSIFVARDRFGIKPLYYSYSDNCFFFSSEMKTILGLKSKNSISQEAIELYAHLRFIPAPYTIVEKVKKLKAGEYLIFENGKVLTTIYFNYNDAFDCPFEFDFVGTLQSEILDTSFSETEMGIFLSGGLDSSIIASVIAHEGRDLKSFSVGYEVQTDNDETQTAQTVAKELNIDNMCFSICNNELLSIINKASYCLEEPLYSTVSIATLKLAQVSQKYVKSILTGDGSDELFYGYKYLLESLKQPDKEQYYLNSIGWVKETQYSDLLLKNWLKQEDIRDILFDGCQMNNDAETFRRIEIFKRLPDYHFPRMERLTNACGLEVRVPYMRNKIVEMALGINCKNLMDDMNPKSFLKTQMKLFVTPTNNINVKRPFTSPTRLWIEQELMNDIKRLFNENEIVSLCGLNHKTINNLLLKYSGTYCEVSEIWGIYMLLKWVEQHQKFLY